MTVWLIWMIVFFDTDHGSIKATYLFAITLSTTFHTRATTLANTSRS